MANNINRKPRRKVTKLKSRFSLCLSQLNLALKTRSWNINLQSLECEKSINSKLLFADVGIFDVTNLRFTRNTVEFNC